jgi:site-specific recombinase XerC
MHCRPRSYSAQLGFEIGAHALLTNAATNALDHQTDVANVQGRPGHANIGTTRIYDETVPNGVGRNLQVIDARNDKLL